MRIGLTYNVRGADDSAKADAREELPIDDSEESRARADLESYLASIADEEEEFDSPQTIQQLAMTLEELGHEVDFLGDGESMLRRLLAGHRPDLVLNIAEGTGSGRSREARVPAALEMLGVPYTGSDPLTLAVTLDKHCAKRLVSAAGVATPRGVLYQGTPVDAETHSEQLAELTLPVIVKPAYEGSSKGVLGTSLVHDRDELENTLEQMFAYYGQPILAEEFIDGDELTVGVLGNASPEVLGIMRVLPVDQRGPFVYSLEVKRDWRRRVRYECPAQLTAADTEQVAQAALDAWQALGCRDVARIDFRLRRGVPYFLEANPLPGLSSVSGDLVLMAGFMGIEYGELIGRILAAACQRLGLPPAADGKSAGARYGGALAAGAR